MNLLHSNDKAGTYPQSWYAATATPLPDQPPLRGAARADVCVIGAGYTGLSAALHLAARGYTVRLLEAQRIGFGASGRNGGQVGSGQRLAQDELETRFGFDDARKLWQIGENAKALVEKLISEHEIDGAHRPGVAHACYSAAEAAHEHKLAAHMAAAYGYDKIETLDSAAMNAATGSNAFAGGIIDHGASHLHPLRFALGIAKAAISAGAILHERSEVHHIARPNRWRVATDQGHVEADHVILACNGYLGGLDRKVAARVMPINNFIVATEPLDSLAPEILPGDIAVADTKFVVNYWRKGEGGRLLFGGGESYGYRFPKDIAALVRKPMLQVYPQLRDVRIDYAWGGTLAITRHRLPHFSVSQPGLYSASGYSGHGVALGTLAGQILAEMVAGTSERFDIMSRLPCPQFPGGTALRNPLLVLAMTWFSMRDRLGV